MEQSPASTSLRSRKRAIKTGQNGDVTHFEIASAYIPQVDLAPAPAKTDAPKSGVPNPRVRARRAAALSVAALRRLPRRRDSRNRPLLSRPCRQIGRPTDGGSTKDAKTGIDGTDRYGCFEPGGGCGAAFPARGGRPIAPQRAEPNSRTNCASKTHEVAPLTWHRPGRSSRLGRNQGTFTTSAFPTWSRPYPSRWGRCSENNVKIDNVKYDSKADDRNEKSETKDAQAVGLRRVQMEAAFSGSYPA